MKPNDRAISREDAIALRREKRGDSFVGNDEQFMRRLSLRGGGMATVICHHCCVAGTYSGHVHVDGDDFAVSQPAQWS